VLDPRALRVEVLDPQAKPALLRAREEPGEERGAEVAEVERSARAGRVATVGSSHSAEHGRPRQAPAALLLALSGWA
jgi:hypothetical protein